jgi:hypothetical protein
LGSGAGIIVGSGSKACADEATKSGSATPLGKEVNNPRTGDRDGDIDHEGDSKGVDVNARV